MKIFYDVDTQNDFMNKDGALYVPDAELIKPNLYDLTVYASKENFPIAGSVDRHFGTEEYKEREGELQRWGGPFPDHCMDGTKGFEKIKEANNWWPNDFAGPSVFGGIYIPHRLDNKVIKLELVKGIAKMIEKDSYLHLYNSLFFEKQSYDVFTNPSFEVFLDIAGVKEAVVYGVATDYCIKAAVLGMQERGIQCYVVEDAIKGVAPDTTKSALEEMVKAKAELVATKDIVEEIL